MSGYRSDDNAARAKIAALEAELRERDAKLTALLFSQTPAKAFSPLRARSFRSAPSSDRSFLEKAFNLIFAVAVAGVCRFFDAQPLWTMIVGSLAYVAFEYVANAWRSRSAADWLPPETRPENAAEVEALAAIIEDRNARIETRDAQIASERAACAELRGRIREAELWLAGDSVRSRESSR